ncbi:MAG: aspartate aminotransferase family protein [Dongiaceae bacterium]
MPLDIAALIAARRGEKYQLHDSHLNQQFVRMLRVIGYDVDFVSGKGPHLFDAAGRRYLDLLSGFGVFALGRNHPAIAAALHQVLDAGLANLVQLDVSLLSGLLAERLLALMPGQERVFFCNSGAEAVEAGIKFARAATGRPGLVHCSHGFHGLTCGALSLNGEDVFRQGFGPLLTDSRRVPFGDLPALEQALSKRDVAAFVVEPVQGHGVHLPPDGYLAEAARLCRRAGTLFVADEVQTGLGRTGRFLASEHWGVEPDMVLLAKALSGGHVPIGAVATKGWIFAKVFDRLDRAVVHGSTFSKNDLAMAAGLATLSVIEEERLVERAATMGAAILADLTAIGAGSEFVRSVRGKGMMIGIEFGPPRSLRLKAAWQLLAAVNSSLFCQMVTLPLFRRHRILCQVAGHDSLVVKLIPSLTLAEEDRVWIRDAFADVIADCERVPGAIWDTGRQLAGHAMRSRAKVAVG